MMLTAIVFAAVMAAPAEPARAAAAAPATPAAPARTLADVLLPPDKLPEGCVPIGEAHAVSLQAESLYSGDLLGGALTRKPVDRQAQPMECGHEKGAVYYYQFATEEDARLTLGFITGFVWGEDHPTSMHPELIDRWGNIVVVISLKHPEPIEKALNARTPGGISAAKPEAPAPKAAQKTFEKAMDAYGRKDYARAETSFRSLAASMPDSAFAHLYLGHSLFYEQRYRDAIPEYEKARDLTAASGELELLNRRILNDNLGMAYGLSGRMQDAKNHFERAIRTDPEYPFYYYNLACAQAETDDLDGAIGNLRKASERRSNFLPGEGLPNPREDDSFRKYLGNPKFEAAVKEIGF